MEHAQTSIKVFKWIILPVSLLYVFSSSHEFHKSSSKVLMIIFKVAIAAKSPAINPMLKMLESNMSPQRILVFLTEQVRRQQKFLVGLS